MPLAQITAPANGSVLWNQAPVAGTASDLNLDSYRIEYSPSGSNGPWSVAALGAASVISGPLGTWVTNDAMNAVLVANGNYDLRLIVIDKAGNYSTAAVPVSVNNLILSNVSASSHTLNTQTNDVSMISYTINGPATVSFKIIPEKEGSAGTPVRQTSQAVAAAGTYSFAWDGKDNTGNVVPDEAYIYVLEAADGTKTDSYAPAATGGGGTLACTQDTYDPYKNDPMIITYSLSQPARVNITASWVSQQYPVIAAIPQAAGSHTVTWDGRSLSGNIIAPNADATCAIASLLGENHIITSGDTPEISNLSVDPYVMKLTYGHVARISYSLQRDALVTITLISPSGASIPALENVYQTAGSHTLQDWSGLDAADSTGKRLLISEEGMYKVIVRAANPQTGNVSTLRGSLNIGY
jgi:flagellar hook assembly protein FlgD